MRASEIWSSARYLRALSSADIGCLYDMRMRSILILMAAVAVAFVVVIWFRFWIHTKTNAIPDNVFGAVAYVAIFGIALFLGCWMLGISPWSGWMVAEMYGPRRVQRRPKVVSNRGP